MFQMKQSSLWLTVSFMMLLGIHATSSSSSYTPEAQKDRIRRLPKARPFSFPYFGGYITLQNGRSLYYNFAASKRSQSTDPIVFYLSGGPGCSSIGLGNFALNGPLVLYKNDTLLENQFSFNNVANIVYIDSPVGAGFSYTDNPVNVNYTDDGSAADNLEFIKSWFDRFPQFKDRDMYLAGESFAGHYIPTLAMWIVNSTENFNFKGYTIGNPFTHFSTDFIYGVQFMYGHALITKEARDNALQACANITNVGIFSADVPVSAMRSRRRLQSACSDAQQVLNAQIGNVDLFDIFADYKCKEEVPRSTRCKDLVYDRAQKYFNRQDVQAAMHANTTGQVPGPWTMCNRTILPLWSQSDFGVRNHAKDYPYLLSKGLRILIFSGDTDLKVPFEGTRAWISSLNLKPKNEWHAWHAENDDLSQPGGWGQSFEEGLTFITVRNAGHFAAMNQRDVGLDLFSKFIKNQEF